MLKDVYANFNKQFTPEKHRLAYDRIFAAAGDPCARLCETPVFITRAFADTTVTAAAEIIAQSLSPALRPKLDAALPPTFRMPSAASHPTFFIIDFAVTADGLKLIEMQAFASNLLFIPFMAEIYSDVYGLDYPYMLSNISEARKAILNGHSPENVILMEINPWEQKSRRDFVLTQKQLGVPVVDVTDVIKEDRQLFYTNADGKKIRIRRIYNRVIATEFESLNLAAKTQFKFSDDLDVEWAGDPAWFLRISKHTMPYLNHPTVPETKFLNQFSDWPQDLENYVLKPIFFNAGIGVKIDITKADLDALPATQRDQYILMKKVSYLPFIPDLKGNMMNTEIRIMFTWADQLKPLAFSARVMQGNDVNSGMWGHTPWTGLTPVFIVD